MTRSPVWLGLALATVGVTDSAAQEPPYLSGYVMDEARMLSPEAVDRLEARLEDFSAETGSQVVVLTVPTLDGRPIEDFAIDRAESWQLGRGDQDDGVLFVVAEAERRMRIEVGYGLEGALTDAASRRILDNVVAPRFRSGDFDGGIEAGVDRILATIRGEVPPPEEPPPSSSGPGGLPPAFFQLAFLLLFILAVRAAQRRAARAHGWSSRHGWRSSYGPMIFPFPRGGSKHDGGSRGSGWFGGGGGFGGGGFSGGGGGFGGGGASGSW